MESRSEQRRTAQIPVSVFSPFRSMAIPMVTRDLSADGAYLTGSKFFMMDKYVICTFALKGGKKLKLFAEVIRMDGKWGEQKGMGLGMAFQEATKEEKETIRSFVAG